MAIDIGAAALDRASFGGGAYTILAKANPANDTGTLDTIEVWGNSNITTFRVGTFYLDSGTTYICRDSANLGNITGGSKQTFTGLSIDVTINDLIGWYYASSTEYVERVNTGGSGFWYISGEYIDPNDSGVYTSDGVHDYSVYGTGTTTTSQTTGGASLAIAGALSRIMVFSQAVGGAASAIAGTLTRAVTFARTVGGASLNIASSLSAGLLIAQVVGEAAMTIAGTLSTIFHDIVEAVKTRWHFPTRSYDGTQADEIEGYGTASDEIEGYGTPQPRYKFPSDYE